MSSTSVDFSSCGDVKDVLIALWNKAKVASFFTLRSVSPPGLSMEEVDGILERYSRNDGSSTYIDYLSGRSMKFDIKSFPVLESRGYDRDLYQGAMNDVQKSLIKK